MIVTRTPLRVSFLGGGSDYPFFFNHHPGAVLGVAINLYVFVAVIEHTPLTDKQFKLTYRVSEAVDRPQEFEHPVARATLEDLQWSHPGLHIATLADVPARTGLGSSSAFTVGLIHALRLIRGEATSADELARAAVRVERELLNESGGWQDQFHSAFGGLALYQFSSSTVDRHGIEVQSLIDVLDRSMVLMPTGGERDSHVHANRMQDTIARSTGTAMTQRLAELATLTYAEMASSSDAEHAVLQMARAMEEAWAIKRELSGHEPSDDVTQLVEHGLRHGALAGKLCGAGGSGFVAFITRPDDRVGFLNRAGLGQGTLIGVSARGSVKGSDQWV